MQRSTPSGSTGAPPGLSAPQQRHAQRLGAAREAIFWRPDPGRAPWEFDTGDDPPPPAPDWFFLLNHPRTGSTVASRLLSAHPAVHCGDDERVLPLLMTLLGSPLFMSQRFPHAVRYEKKLPVTPGRMRLLMDAWRRCVSDRPLYGDKGDAYYTHFGNACLRVFPGCKLLLTVRNPLDTLSSFLEQSWTAYLHHLYPDEAALFGALRVRGWLMLAANRRWREQAVVVRFEELTSEERFRQIFGGVFSYLGADPGAFDWRAGWGQCRHAGAMGRWRRDERIGRFVAWLRGVDPSLHDLLVADEVYLPAGIDAPPPEAEALEEGLRTALAWGDGQPAAAGRAQAM
ncbi:MAG TPA: sulfotransferase [Thermoanaerobaculia bacterium]|nr:sulfotransferase [Thermoanaerobaculia bacterium]